MSNRERIAAVLVGEEDRIMCLPRLFGLARMIEVEAVTYGYMSKLSADTPHVTPEQRDEMIRNRRRGAQWRRRW